MSEGSGASEEHPCKSARIEVAGMELPLPLYGKTMDIPGKQNSYIYIYICMYIYIYMHVIGRFPSEI